MPHIDHICVPEAWAERTTVVDAWPGTIDGVRLSDHSAVVIEIGGVADASVLREEIRSTRFNS